MSLNDFVIKWEGKPCEIGGSANALNQCVDLANAYITEVLKQPAIFWTNAVDFPEKIDRTKYDWIENTPTGIAPEGAVVVFKQYGTRYGSVGHIAVTLAGCTNSTLNLFEQNYPTGSLCKKNSRNYLGCRGWFVLKQPVNTYKGYDLENADSMKICVDKMVEIMEGKYISIDEHSKIINELDAKSTASAQSYANDKTILEEKIKTLEEIIKQIQETEHDWAGTADKLQRKLKSVLYEFEKVGIVLSTESDEADIVSKISLYITSRPKDQSVLINNLNDQINNLKKKETAFRTVNIGNIIIKFYKR